MRFRAELKSTGKTTTGFQVPPAVLDELGGGRHPKVKVTLNGHTFGTSIARMGEHFLLGVSAERRAAASVSAGDVLDVEVELDTASRTVDVPEDLAVALGHDRKAEAFWETLSYSAKQWHVLQVTGAKTPETRSRRVSRSVELLSQGRAR